VISWNMSSPLRSSAIAACSEFVEAEDVSVLCKWAQDSSITQTPFDSSKVIQESFRILFPRSGG
jgi:hypothetical protein